MDLSNLKPAEGATHSEQRLGRGEGSGRGAHSSTRGTKGQSSRSGAKNRPIWFEGGQTSLFRRVPKHGFNSPFPTEYSTVNVGRIQRLIDEDRIDPDEPITPDVLEEAGAIRDAGNVKILGDGVLDAAIEASSHAYSDSAREKIEDAGGTASVVEGKSS